jgi:hypothetical protein
MVIEIGDTLVERGEDQFPLPLWERVRERGLVSSFDTRNTNLDLW